MPSCLGLSAFMFESSMSQVELLHCILLWHHLAPPGPHAGYHFLKTIEPARCLVLENYSLFQACSMLLLCTCLWMAYPWIMWGTMANSCMGSCVVRTCADCQPHFVLGLWAVTCGVWSMLKNYICCGCMWMAYPYQADSLQG